MLLRALGWLGRITRALDDSLDVWDDVFFADDARGSVIDWPAAPRRSPGSS